MQVVVEGPWLSPGSHINAIGANFARKRELGDAAVRRANPIAVDSLEQAKMEAGDLIQAYGNDESRWNSTIELSGIVAGKVKGRTTADQITLFKSIGIATWDLAVAARVYELAKERGLGTRIPLWEIPGNK
jgi:ornithine cyclodeaminase/alanine dehydrogenase-like protein (mu-crystallin family)